MPANTSFLDTNYHFELPLFANNTALTTLLGKYNELTQQVFANQRLTTASQISEYTQLKLNALKNRKDLITKHDEILCICHNWQEETNKLEKMKADLLAVDKKITLSDESLARLGDDKPLGQIILRALQLAAAVTFVGVLPFTLLALAMIPSIAVVVASSFASYLLFLGETAALSMAVAFIGTLIPVYYTANQSIENYRQELEGLRQQKALFETNISASRTKVSEINEKIVDLKEIDEEQKLDEKQALKRTSSLPSIPSLFFSSSDDVSYASQQDTNTLSTTSYSSGV
jgi:peptidoglycan hydrolase CwlO-like protein